MRDVDERALKAREKKAALGPDVDLSTFTAEPVKHAVLNSLNELSDEDRRQMIKAGIDAGEAERSGSYIQMDTAAVFSRSKQEGLEVIPIKRALKECNWINDYYWKLVSVDADKYTAKAQLELHDGYVIRALPGSRVIYPVQACLYLDKENLSQYVHNLIIAEEGSELHVITGCATAPHLRRGLHVGISEFFVKKNAKLSFTMIHQWAEEMMVRPRSVGMVEEGGLFLNNYICMKPVKSLQMYPTTHLVGKGAVSRFYSLLVGNPGTELDVGGRVFLKAEDTRAEIIARAISNGGTIISRGDLVGEVPGVKAHLECRGLILKGGVIHAIPELRGTIDGVEMSHEAAVGKIAQEEILYLMSRGLSEDAATATIVRGFLTVDIPGLPAGLKAEIDRAVDQTEKDMM
ncbi:MAG TPA: SufD family Fe-S cluster assembly protein [Syntrophales bacterium]|nr:SufD family Fe-S cluster assembly protein [Syntrophales bacterium]HOX94960.1 SufD family Fe-S cluster assembly protein [Syntrophales bacterium]HPI55797.1 SufD family Fe-S cluster assembly protein [Syntrophales bacterium]HPN23711.1 SufD family Fe-S cluster assembly protein [Syntrophales bacterium]HQM27763.1 SufD family Fe-S cluster assembly protein [Syntrophales bacterium]